MASTMVFCDRGKVNVSLKESLEPTKSIKFEVWNEGGYKGNTFIPAAIEEVTLFVTEEQAAQIADSLFGQLLVMKAKKAAKSDA